MIVEEHRMSLAEKKRFLREYNKAHPKPPMPHGWWIAPGLFVAVLIVIALVAL